MLTADTTIGRELALWFGGHVGWNGPQVSIFLETRCLLELKVGSVYDNVVLYI